jgi:acyl carrier protein
MSEKRFPEILIEANELNKGWRDARLLIKQILTEKLSVSRQRFTSASKIGADLGGDSLDLVEIAINLEKTTGVRVDERVPFHFVVEIVDYLHFIRTWDK